MLAYPVLARNDLHDNFLQGTDFLPDRPVDQAANVRGYYFTYFVQNDTVVTADAGAGVWTTSAAYNGLAAYLLDNVENVLGGNLATTAAQAITMAAAILTRVAAGLSVSITDINTIIVASLGAGADLNGDLAGSHSTGSIEDVLGILAGDVYQIAASTAISGAANAFLATPVGGFLTSSDTGFRYRNPMAQTGALILSELSGQISKLEAATYTWLNPSNTYGAAGDALNIAGGHIAATGTARALVMYDDEGELF